MRTTLHIASKQLPQAGRPAFVRAAGWPATCVVGYPFAMRGVPSAISRSMRDQLSSNEDPPNPGEGSA